MVKSTLMSAIVSNGGNVVADGTRTNSYSATYSDSSGILESISLSYGEFSLEVLCAEHFTHQLVRPCSTSFMSTQFLGRSSSHMYTLSLSPRYLNEPDGAGSLERVTGVLSSTISVPDTAIAEYSPTVTVELHLSTSQHNQYVRGYQCSVFWCSFHVSFHCSIESVYLLCVYLSISDLLIEGIVLILLFWQCQKMMI